MSFDFYDENTGFGYLYVKELIKMEKNKMKLYRGWMKSGLEHCLFEVMRDELKIGDILTDAFGREWIVETIF